MIVLNRIVFYVGLTTVVLWLAYLGSLATVIIQLWSYKPSFSEFMPVPHGKLAEQYAQLFPRSLALRRVKFLWAATMCGLVSSVSLDLLLRIVR